MNRTQAELLVDSYAEALVSVGCAGGDIAGKLRGIIVDEMCKVELYPSYPSYPTVRDPVYPYKPIVTCRTDVQPERPTFEARNR